MPVVNIVDERTHKHNVAIDAIFEPSTHDNSCKGATQFEETVAPFVYRELYKTTVAEAIAEMDGYRAPITLYMYDFGSNPGGKVLRRNE